MGYTVMPADHLLAFGMSGISEVANTFAQSAPKLAEWHDLVDAGKLPIVRGHQLSQDDVQRRATIMQLMCNLELSLTDVPFSIAEAVERLRPLEEDGLITIDAERLRVTPLGRYFVRNVCMAFDAYLPAEPSADTPRFSRAI